MHTFTRSFQSLSFQRLPLGIRGSMVEVEATQLSGRRFLPIARKKLGIVGHRL
jgi:hypothetical protein